MKKLLLPVLTISTLLSVAQNNDAVLMEIGNKKISKSEFENIYRKNNKEKSADKKSIAEYLDLFTNFKLKVKEAEDLGLDTTTQFKAELESYRKQLSQPYLTDKDASEQLIKEAYERTKFNIKASHILATCDPNAIAKDTIIAYNKIMSIRNRVVKGEDFGKLAFELSGDPSAKDNKGDLGYFSALQMVYPVENVAFNTKKGDISMPVRTKFGYHIVKIIDRRNDPGTVTAAHILTLFKKGQPKEDSTRQLNKINEIYSNIISGKSSFEETAKQFSDDKSSSSNGGILKPFTTGRMVEEFENAVFDLKQNNDISKPFRTQFGWHIVKLIDKKIGLTYEEQKNDLKQRIQRDSRAQKSKETFISKVKKEYNFEKENIKNIEGLGKTIDSSFTKNKWQAAVNAKGYNKPIFSFANKVYTQTDYANYLEKNMARLPKGEGVKVVKNCYQNFTDEICLNYEETQLSKKYLDYRLLLDEYKDGILLFDLTDVKVWSAAVKDSLGLQDFYSKNKNNYLWEERYEIITYKCKDQKIVATLTKLQKKKMSNDEILKIINKDSQLNLNIERSTIKKGENINVDKNIATNNLNFVVEETNLFVKYQIEKILPKGPKKLDETRGLVTADYQNFLEKEWIKDLKVKYKVVVNENVLNTIK